MAAKARTLVELFLYITEHPCPVCGRAATATELDKQVTYLSDTRALAVYAGPCPQCKTPLRYEFDVPRAGFPQDAVYGAAQPSELFSETDWRRMASRDLARVAGEPPEDVRAFFEHRRRLVNGRMMLDEAKKSAPRDAAEIDADLLRTRPLLARYDALLATMQERSRALPQPPPKLYFTKEVLDAHKAWLARGKTGEGRLVLEDQSVGGIPLGNLNVQSARLVKVSFRGSRVDFAHFEEAELVECSAIETNFGHTVFDRARLERCTFDRAGLVLTDFHDVRVTGGSFVDATMDRSTWARMIVTDCDLRDARFGDCVLDGTRFEGCNFRGANLARKSTLPMCTTTNTTFVRCDLRGAKVAGRRFDRTSFIDCQLDDIEGKPDLVGPVTIEGPGAEAARARWS